VLEELSLESELESLEVLKLTVEEELSLESELVLSLTVEELELKLLEELGGKGTEL
jgi:hypothetical protein